MSQDTYHEPASRAHSKDPWYRYSEDGDVPSFHLVTWTPRLKSTPFLGDFMAPFNRSTVSCQGRERRREGGGGALR